MPSYNYPSILLVGRPNVGKSTLFNRLMGKRKAIVEAQPGTTRDCVEGVFSWSGKKYEMADTGGIQVYDKHADDLAQSIKETREPFLAHAKLALLVCDGHSPLSVNEEEIARDLTRRGLPVIVVVNKIDHEGMLQDSLSEYSTLGFKHVVGVSALHGLGIHLLCDFIAELVPGEEDREAAEKFEFSVAIIGEPNVGKSTLLNKILGMNRAAVSEKPGTTRDPVETCVTYSGRHIQIVDTAGARRKRKVNDSLDFYSQTRTLAAMKAAQVVLLIFDATQGVGRNASMLAENLIEDHKSCVLVANKWDLVKGSEQGMYRKVMQSHLKYMQYCPMVFISAKTGKNIDAPFKAALQLWDRGKSRIEGRKLMQCLNDFQRAHRHPLGVKIKFGTQVDVSPPHFVLFTNRHKGVLPTYVQAIRNELSQKFDLGGIFFRLTLKSEVRSK